MLARAHSPAAFRCLDFLGSLSRGTRLPFPGNVGCKWALSIWSKSDEQRRVRENSRTVYQGICNPRQKSWDTKKFSPPPTLNVDNQVIFSLFVGKTRYFPTLIRGDGGYVIQLKCPNYFWPGLWFFGEATERGL